ncbi:MAG: ribose-phosphate diphosphokinase [Candidatus ainarchaeum sp.]|nr:ribose-phosphate diphosphokinase [Candidatus ainarchaeum sp.]MDD5096072.1 ribose-phosphate diphosphokinase [Candidatus ainarchaeum sp.]
MRFVSPNCSDLYEPNIEMKQFPDGDDYVRLVDLKADGPVFLLHRLYPEQDKALMQAVLMLRTLKEKGYRTALVAPYLPYSRQDKIFKEGEAKSAEYVCEMLKWAGADRLITFDCHFMKKAGEAEYGGLKIASLSMGAELIERAKGKFGDGFEIVSPDLGASYLVERSGGKSMEKVRGEYQEGGEAYRRIEGIRADFEIKGKDVLILDDMISTGSTMIRAAETLKQKGAKKIAFAATHGFFLKDSLQKLGALGDVFVSDSVPSPVSEVSIKRKVESLVGI